MNEEMNTVSEEQVLHNKLSFEINQELIHLMKRIVELQQENARLKEIENKLNFIKNRVKQGMSQENINKCAIELVNSYLKEN